MRAYDPVRATASWRLPERPETRRLGMATVDTACRGEDVAASRRTWGVVGALMLLASLGSLAIIPFSRTLLRQALPPGFPPQWLPLALALSFVLASNGLPGLAFGWLYWRRGLLAARAAHAAADVVLKVVLPLVPFRWGTIPPACPRGRPGGIVAPGPGGRSGRLRPAGASRGTDVVLVPSAPELGLRAHHARL